MIDLLKVKTKIIKEFRDELRDASISVGHYIRTANV